MARVVLLPMSWCYATSHFNNRLEKQHLKEIKLNETDQSCSLPMYCQVFARGRGGPLIALSLSSSHSIAYFIESRKTWTRVPVNPWPIHLCSLLQLLLLSLYFPKKKLCTRWITNKLKRFINPLLRIKHPIGIKSIQKLICMLLTNKKITS